MRGDGARYDVIAQLFRTVAARLGLSPPPPAGPTSFRRPFRQQGLFEAT